jgi:hypothetical protein
MSKTALQERARELEIPGRSSMDEAELEAAIAQAEGRPAPQPTTEGSAAAGALAARDDEPTTIAVARAKRAPHRVIGATPDTDDQEA